MNRFLSCPRDLGRIFLGVVFVGLMASSCATHGGSGGGLGHGTVPEGGVESELESELEPGIEPKLGIGSSGSVQDEGPGVGLDSLVEQDSYHQTPIAYLDILDRISSLSQVRYEPWMSNQPEQIIGPATQVQPLDPTGLARLLVLQRMFPEKIQWIFPGSEDWLISLEGTRFRWAEGRMLYAHQPFGKEERERYMPIWDLRGLDLPIWQRKITSDQEAELLDLNERYGFDPRIRNQGFLDLLYDAPDQLSSQETMVRTTIFDLSLDVHPIVVPALRRVEGEILRLAGQHPEVQEYIDSLGQAWGFFWRPIAGTNRRSMHSYGIAIDLLPEYYERRFPYWRWALESGFPQWWLLPPRQFYYPHPLVVEAFEQEGFLWGGRWTGFDTIHFEYRPEFMAFEEPLEPLLSKDGRR